MSVRGSSLGVVFYALFILFGSYECSAHALEVNRSAVLSVDASPHSARQIPETLFGIFFEVSLNITNKLRHKRWQHDFYLFLS